MPLLCETEIGKNLTPNSLNSQLRSSSRLPSILLTARAMGLPSFCSEKNIRRSSSLGSSLPSVIKIIKSALFASLSVLACTRANSSEVSSKPPESITRMRRSKISASALLVSRVVPATSLVMAIRAPARRLKRLDLPTLGRPMMIKLFTFVLVVFGAIITKNRLKPNSTRSLAELSGKIL